MELHKGQYYLQAKASSVESMGNHNPFRLRRTIHSKALTVRMEIHDQVSRDYNVTAYVADRANSLRPNTPGFETMFYNWSDLQKLGHSNNKSRAASIFRKIDFELYMIPWTRSVLCIKCYASTCQLHLRHKCWTYHWALCSDNESCRFKTSDGRALSNYDCQRRRGLAAWSP